MAFSISWTDYPEPADSDEYMKGCFLQRVQKDGETGEFSSLYNFISGDNYPVLRLLERDYSEKIDFIYIDPPYNTGKKFVYNDSFSGGSAQDRHSVWLSFMKRRLVIARELLSETGCIFIAIGNEELYHLKLLCDMIFGEENFVNDFMWLCGKGKKDSHSRTLEQSTLCYAKNKRRLGEFAEFQETEWATVNPDNDERGPWFSGSISFSEKRSNPSHPNYFEIVSPSGVHWKRQWLISREKMDELLRENKIYWGPAPEFSNVPRSKVFNGQKTKIIPKNIIDGANCNGTTGAETAIAGTISTGSSLTGSFRIGTTRDAQNYVDKLLGIKNAFDNPKPVGLIEHLISITAMKDDITVLDFFAGSGTTMEAVYRLNQLDGGKRRCILVQKPEKIEIEGHPFTDLSQLCLERCKRAGLPESQLTEFLLVLPSK